MELNKNLYMCPPTHLDLIYTINPFMDLKAYFSREKAQA